MTIRPVSRTTLGEQVAKQLVEMITAEKWKAGEKLPSEADLCRAFNIGRSTLREALKSLAFLGMVRMRAGEGTYVTEGPSMFFERVLTAGALTTEKEISDWCETRIALETELVALCAQRATDPDILRLKTIVKRMEEAVETDSFGNIDLEFHLAIAAASQNRVLSHMLRAIRGLLHEWIMKSQQTLEAKKIAHQQHVAILRTIMRRNPSRARAAMSSHLKTFQRGYALVRTVAEVPRKNTEPESIGRDSDGVVIPR
jgi:GntR family transcriptional repressor for pyruvate dehydrogenase complex